MRSTVGGMDQWVGQLRPALVEGLLQGFEHEVCSHGAAHPPADDALAVNINPEGHEQPALPDRDIGEVRHTHSSLVRLGLNSRLTRSSGLGAEVSGVVICIRLPRRRSARLSLPISLSIVQRAT